MKKFIAFGLLAFAGLQGCQKESNNTTPQPACPAGTTCVSKVDASSAVSYFNQFIEQTVGGTCADASTLPSLRFQWLALANRIVVGKDASGNDAVAELNLFLEQDGTYTGQYQENVQKLVDPGFYQNVGVQNQKLLKGTWSVQGAQLIISDIGIVDGAASGVVAVNNWPGVSIPVKDSKVSAQLMNQTLLMTNIRSTISKDMKTAEQYCKDLLVKAGN